MKLIFGILFLLLGLWQLVMFKRAFSHLKHQGDKTTSPFIMLSLWSGLLFAIVFLGISFSCFFGG